MTSILFFGAAAIAGHVYGAAALDRLGLTDRATRLVEGAVERLRRLLPF
jgi:hypothetical protein